MNKTNEKNVFLTCGNDNLFNLSNYSIVACQKKQDWETKGISKEQLDQLQKELNIIYPWNNDYYWLRENYQKRDLMYPMGIVKIRNNKDLSYIWSIIRKHKIPFSIRSGGHSYENLSLTNGIIIDCGLLKTFTINENNITTIGAGYQLDHVIIKLSNKDLAIPTGTCPNVGIVGLTLGGGIGLLLRKYGLTCDHLIGCEMMLANGKFITIDQNNYPDLYWACRGGGGGNFGIITKLIFKPIKISKVTWFTITWSRKYFQFIFDIWQKWSPNVDPNLSTVFHINNNPEKIKIEGIFIGNSDDLSLLLKPFNLYNASLNIYYGSYLDSAKFFATKPNFPFFKAKSSFITHNLPSYALNIINKHMNISLSTSDNPISYGLYIAAFGGINNDISSNYTAFPHRHCKYWIQFIIHWSNPLQQSICMSWINQLYKDLMAFMPRKTYINCPDLDLSNALEQYYGDNLSKLKLIKQKYDPDNIFNFPQSL